MRGFLNSVLEFLVSVTKYGDMKPLSHLTPSTYSTSVSKVFPSYVVIVALGPSLSKIPERIPPITLSPFAEIVATFSISSLFLTEVDIFYSSETT